LLQISQGAALAAATGSLGDEADAVTRKRRHSGPGPKATETLPFENGERPLVRYPQKRPLLRLTTRPPQLETPFAVFDEGPLTPNDAFFVRYHLGTAPPDVDAAAWRIKVHGLVEHPFELDMKSLKTDFRPIEYVAVLQCSGNSRGFFQPRVGGGQAGNGLMGCARWKGVPLKAVLAKAGVKPGVKQLAFNGADDPVLPGTPDFVKALDLDHAADGEVMLAYEMNGKELPILNGHPVRLIVPGWYGTYWVKHVTDIEALDHVLDNFWMKTAYRIPDNDCACVAPGTTPAATVPINRLNTRSFITSVRDGARERAGKPLNLHGIAFDGGTGIKSVEVSTDGGKTWRQARLGPDLGKYAYRPWSAQVTLGRGKHALKVRAVNNAGQGQPAEPRWNPSGYMRNVIETVNVTAV
jgi:DMSO/TMAO reductase YedYZ molybdopterin-dependent catalytic subunit